jgi:hypothetical protein
MQDEGTSVIGMSTFCQIHFSFYSPILFVFLSFCFLSITISKFCQFLILLVSLDVSFVFFFHSFFPFSFTKFCSVHLIYYFHPICRSFFLSLSLLLSLLILSKLCLILLIFLCFCFSIFSL